MELICKHNRNHNITKTCLPPSAACKYSLALPVIKFVPTTGFYKIQ